MPEEVLTQGPSLTENTQSGASILIIDDESGIRESLETLLTFEGYTLRMAVDGEEGLRILDQESFDLVLLDLALPGTKWHGASAADSRAPQQFCKGHALE